MKATRRNRSFGKIAGSCLVIGLLLGLLVLTGCGGGNSSDPPASGQIAGDWQFSMASPADGSFIGGLQGGFLLQQNSTASGSVVYSIAVPQSQGVPTICNSGTTPVKATVTGQNVSLTAVAGAQLFTLTGTLSKDGSTIMGTYTTTDGKGCGTAQSGLQWSAVLVQPLTGAVEGSFHSTGGNSRDQNFQVTGTLTQGPNIGASNATVTGTLTFQNYPCLDSASVNGQISGSSVVLHVIATSGLEVGQIGALPGSTNPGPVVFDTSSKTAGYVLHGTNGYGITTKTCPGGNTPGDQGNICFALSALNSQNPSTACTQPVLFTPAALSFPDQEVGSFPTVQTITLTNNDPSGSSLDGMTLKLVSNAGSFGGPSDFTGLPNFTEHDSCAGSPGATFNLGPQQSCSINISFSPQQSCPWLPFPPPGSSSASALGAAPTLCPFPLTASLAVNSPKSVDADTTFSAPVTGYGLSALVPSAAELDFGSEALGETSPAQTLSFTNQSQLPVEILPPLSGPCVNPDRGLLVLPRPLAPGEVNGFQVLTGLITPDGTTIDYLCDSDLTSLLPNFQISADSCSGRVLAYLESCSIEVSLVPQPATAFVPMLDYFLELDTLQCTSDVTSDCEIDSGRFPIELKANTPSPLRMSPGAGLDFGLQPKGQLSGPLSITLFNDPNDPNTGTVNFTGNLVKGDYVEIDDCGSSLAPGHTCTLTFNFKPQVTGFDPGSFTITYAVGQFQTIYLRGTGN